MKIFVFSIFDNAAKAYARPFFAVTDAMAMRGFRDIACDASSDVGKHPSDYALFRLGIFDDVSGCISGDALPECLVSAQEMVALDAMPPAGNGEVCVGPGGEPVRFDAVEDPSPFLDIKAGD